MTTAGRLGVVARAVAGFLLGAVMAVFLPPLAIAMALVLGGVLAWTRLRGPDDAQPLTPLAVGYVVAVAVYVVLAVVAQVG